MNKYIIYNAGFSFDVFRVECKSLLAAKRKARAMFNGGGTYIHDTDVWDSGDKAPIAKFDGARWISYEYI